MRAARGAAGAAGLLLIATLAGCTSAGPTPIPSPPSASASAVAASTAEPSSPVATSPAATPVASAGTPTMTAAPADAPATSTPRPGGGCSPTASTVRVGMTATISDVDHDGRADQEFYSEDRPLRYGVRTASGATILLPDDLPGDVHRGWTGVTEQGVRTVIDDETTAEPYAFADCRFTRLRTADGSPYSFALGGKAVLTGVACTDQNGGTFLAASRATRGTDGRWTVRWGILQALGGDRFRADSTTSGTPRWAGLSESDVRVEHAGQSRCGDAPIVYWPDA